MRGGTIDKLYDAEGKRIGLSGKAEWPKNYGREPTPTDDDFKAIIDIMKESGKLPPDFLKAANPAFDVSKYGFGTEEFAGALALGGALPGNYEMQQLESMLYRYTNFNEYLAEMFSDRMLINAATNMLKDEKSIGLLNQIIDLLTDWFVGAYNWAKRHGRKDLMDDIIRRIQRGDFNSLTYDKAQRELERPYDTWLSETGGQRGLVAGSARGEITSGMGGPKKSVFDTLGRIREIEGGEQGGGAFAQSPQLQPADRWGSRGVATEAERAQMNAYLKQAREKWGVGPLGHRRTGPADQELQPPYQPQSMPVEKTQDFLRNPRGTVEQEIRTGRLEDPIISRRGRYGMSPDAPPPGSPMVPFGAGDEGSEGMSGPFAAGVARMWAWYRRMEQDVAKQVRDGILTDVDAEREMELIIRERDQEIENLRRETGGGTWQGLDEEVARRVRRAERQYQEWQREVFEKMNAGKMTGEEAARELQELKKDFEGELEIIRQELGSRPHGNIKYTDPDTDGWNRGR